MNFHGIADVCVFHQQCFENISKEPDSRQLFSFVHFPSCFSSLFVNVKRNSRLYGRQNAFLIYCFLTLCLLVHSFKFRSKKHLVKLHKCSLWCRYRACKQILSITVSVQRGKCSFKMLIEKHLAPIRPLWSGPCSLTVLYLPSPLVNVKHSLHICPFSEWVLTLFLCKLLPTQCLRNIYLWYITLMLEIKIITVYNISMKLLVRQTWWN